MSPLDRPRFPLARPTIGLAALLGLAHCAPRTSPRSVPGASPEQKIVDRAADAVERMRASGEFESMDYFLEHAEGVMVFPRLVKASVIFGGEGGNGVLLARGPDGTWSAPAFYSFAAGSVGFQFGYQETTVLIFVMNRAALVSATRTALAFGADASFTAGNLGESGGAASASVTSDLYYLVEVGGVYVGASLDGAVVTSRRKFDEGYYGAGATSYAIVIDRRFDHPGARALRDALGPAPRAVSAPPAPVSNLSLPRRRVDP